MIHAPDQTPSRAIGYVRVSTDEQGERGYGLAAQEAAIREEVARRGWTLVATLTDVASGKSVRRRPRYREVLRMLANGEADVLVVAKLDRLSRSLIDFAQVMATAHDQGWRINALDIGVDTSSVNGELIAHIIMALAQWERRIIGQRTTAALAQVRSHGTRLGRPRGVDEETVRLICALRDAGHSWQRVADVLTEQGVPTGQGGAWHASTVRKLAARAR